MIASHGRKPGDSDALRSFAARCFVVAALSGLALAGRSPASAEELVKFDSALPRLHQGPDALPSRQPGVQGYLTRPSGDGLFPAVVLLHSCLGLPANKRSIAAAIARWGYVALFVDDFTTRGLKETCAEDFAEGLSDAFGALLYLSRLPYVNSTRIGVVGYSQGADVALKIASSGVGAFALADGVKFKAAAAFYPPCQNQAAAKLDLPTLILIGELDHVTPAADCERLAKVQPGDLHEIRLVVYPDAYHGFDNPSFAKGARTLGMWLQYDRNAAERSLSELHDFLAAKLAK